MRLQRQLAILFQTIFLVSVLLGCSKNNLSAKTTEFLTYEDKNNHFSINYPSDWSVDTSQKDVSVMFDAPKESDQDIYTENISVTAFSLPVEATSPMENYKNGIIETVKKQSPGIEILNTSSLTINNQPALKIEYKGKRDNIELAYQMTYVFKGKMGYVMVFASVNGDFDKYSSTVDKIINSFKVTN